ncbi:tetratricopeptide repeat protein [Archangium lansingense]|uniref:tetratricopeptide repeat protein n=1 Tax=Archangium lansingense TaxID=2995310 RepID=UPI003B82BEF7
MKVSCPSCQTNYNIDDKRIPPGGAKLKCARCQNTFPIKAEEPVSAPTPAAIPLPGPPAPQADPYAGYDDFQRPPEAETTRVVAMPVPSAAYRDNSTTPTAPQQVIPLPGAAMPSADYSGQDYGQDTSAGGAIPLPGTSDPYASDPYASDPYASGAPQGEAVPLPGSFDSNPYGADPYAADPYAAAPQADAIALPPPPAGNPYGSDPYAADPYAADPYAADPYAAAPQADAIALPPPPSSEEPYPYAATPAGAIALPPPPASDPYAAADDSFLASHQPNTSEVDTFALPPPPESNPYDAAPGADSGADDPFGLPPAQVEPEADPFGLPPAPAADPFAAGSGADEDPFDLPPAQVEPEEDPFAPPPPSADPFADEDPFALPPAQGAEVTSVDFSEPSPSTVDVGMDFSEPPPAAPMASAEASIPDALEFDPSAPLPGGDDLEADLSAPLPPLTNPGTADGLEMLSFIDDAAKDSGANKARSNVRRFHVRRRSGKVFGPFEEGVVVKMLEDGQLLGNEDVSNDGDSWTPIGTVPTFAAAIQKLMEGPGTPAVAAPPQPATEPGSKANLNSAANMEKLQQMYGGRMAPVAVTDSTTKMEIILGKLKQRLPLVISVAAALLVLIVGFSFGATRYGVFGLKKFLPSKVKPGTSEHADVEAARKAMLQDSFQGYKQAQTLTEKVLAGSEYPEVRAIWCQAVFHLQRRYSGANSSDLSRCRSEEEAASLELLGEENVEYTKYQVGSALIAGNSSTAVSLAKGAWSANQGDVELGLLLAEAQAAQKKDSAEAIDTLNKVLKAQPDLARAHHALGNAYQAGGKADEAAKAYEAALKADATHLSSSVELAAVELLLRKDAQKGLEAAERALDEKSQAQMSPPELSRARTFKGIALFQLARLEDAEKELRAALEKDSKALILKTYLARVLHAQRKFEEALPFHEEVAKAEAQNLEATDGYISTLVTLGKFEDARKRVEEAVKRFKDNARLEYLYGRIEELTDHNPSAEEHYTRALKADEKLIEAHVALGRLHLRLRRNDQAKAHFETASTLAPENAWVQLSLGEQALAAEDTTTAQAAFERAVSLDANLADAHLGLSRLALLAGDLEKAQKEADTALSLDPHTLRGARMHRGLVLWRQGKLDDAIAELEQAKKEDPRAAGPPITLAAVLLDKGNGAPEGKETEAASAFKTAELNLMAALKSEPSNAEANFYMARVLKAQVDAQVKAAKAKAVKDNADPETVPGGDYTLAIESMRTAVERASKRTDYRYAFGALYRDAKKLPEAIEQWQEAVKLDPKMADAHEALGQAHLERNEFEEALTAFQAALKVEPKRTRVYVSIGNTHFNATRWREAIRAYEQALKADPALTEVFYKVGRSWSEQNQYGKAIDWYVKATKSDKVEPEAWYHLGYAYKEKGKKKEAIKSFQEYLGRKPDAVDRKEVEDEITFLE